MCSRNVPFPGISGRQAIGPTATPGTIGFRAYGFSLRRWDYCGRRDTGALKVPSTYGTRDIGDRTSDSTVASTTDLDTRAWASWAVSGPGACSATTRQ